MKLSAKNICKKFGHNTALDNFSCEFESGHIYGLLGRNGAGKSTLLNIITDRIYSDEGVVSIDGTSCKNNSKQLEKIHLMSDRTYYLEDEKCEKIIKWAGQLNSNFDCNKALQLAKKFNFNLKKTFKGHSSGNRTIFKDIMALSMNVPFVFFDEPTMGLDAIARNTFYKEVISYFGENSNCCIVISTHLIEEISPLIDSFYMIKDGKNILDGNKEDTISNFNIVRGKESAVKSATCNAKIYSEHSSFGVYESLVEGDVKDSESVEIIKPSLQDLFINVIGGDSDV